MFDRALRSARRWWQGDTPAKRFRWLAEKSARSRPNQNPGERLVHQLWWLIAEVSNGSLHQYLSNSTGDDFDETMRYLSQIGALPSRRILDELARLIFPDGIVPVDREARARAMAEWELRAGSQEAIGRLTREFNAEVAGLIALIVMYAEQQEEYFPDLVRASSA